MLNFRNSWTPSTKCRNLFLWDFLMFCRLQTWFSIINLFTFWNACCSLKLTAIYAFAITGVTASAEPERAVTCVAENNYICLTPMASDWAWIPTAVELSRICWLPLRESGTSGIKAKRPVPMEWKWTCNVQTQR